MSKNYLFAPFNDDDDKINVGCDAIAEIDNM